MALDNEPDFDPIEAESIVAETIRAKSFDLVDDDNIRLSLYTADVGTPTVTRLDESAQEQLTISLDEKQRPFIVFLGEYGQRQFALIISPQGTPNFACSTMRSNCAPRFMWMTIGPP